MQLVRRILIVEKGHAIRGKLDRSAVPFFPIMLVTLLFFPFLSGRVRFKRYGEGFDGGFSFYFSSG